MNLSLYTAHITYHLVAVYNSYPSPKVNPEGTEYKCFHSSGSTEFSH